MNAYAAEIRTLAGVWACSVLRPEYTLGRQSDETAHPYYILLRHHVVAHSIAHICQLHPPLHLCTYL